MYDIIIFNRFMKFPNFPHLKNYRFGVLAYILNEWEMWKIWDFMCLYIKYSLCLLISTRL